MTEGRANLRDSLRCATARAHHMLDAAMGDVITHGDYVAMLQLQHQARAGIEDWLAEHAPTGWLPPPQTPLIAADLAQLQVPCPAATPTFDAPAKGFWGIAWAIAGSHLGNRAMLATRRKAGLSGADSFLSDPAMAAYWRQLVPRLAAPAEASEAAAASRAAEQVFGHFAALVGQPRQGALAA